jgi:HEPN domain-containing protein
MSAAADRWLAFAREDFRMAQLALRESIFNQACFHSQQCVEKALKAVITHRQDIAPPRTHAVADLLQLLPVEWLPHLRAQLIEKMDDFYIPTRYPDALPGALPDSLPGQTEATEAVTLAQQVLNEVGAILTPPPTKQ